MADEHEGVEGELQGQGVPALPDVSEFDEQLARLKTSAAGVKQKRAEDEQAVAKRRATEQSDAQSLGAGLQIAYAIIGFPVLGFLAGLGVDHFAGTQYWKGFLGFAGCVLAVVTAMVLIKQANSPK